MLPALQADFLLAPPARRR